MTKQPAKPKKKAASRSGGVSIGGNVGRVGGDIVSGDKTVHGDDIKIGDVGAGAAVGVGRGARASVKTGADAAKLFEQVAALVKQNAPTDKQAEAQQKVAELQEQAQATKPDIGIVGKSLKWLKKNVPGVSGALNTVLSQPIIGQGIKDIAAVILEDED